MGLKSTNIQYGVKKYKSTVWGSEVQIYSMGLKSTMIYHKAEWLL